MRALDKTGLMLHWEELIIRNFHKRITVLWEGTNNWRDQYTHINSPSNKPTLS